jgi:hypothetical protein
LLLWPIAISLTGEMGERKMRLDGGATEVFFAYASIEATRVIAASKPAAEIPAQNRAFRSL